VTRPRTTSQREDAIEKLRDAPHLTACAKVSSAECDKRKGCYMPGSTTQRCPAYLPPHSGRRA
jgi:hypothetical protein